jgi:hypothetical protein
MPVDYQEIQNQIRAVGGQAAQRAAEQQQRGQGALDENYRRVKENTAVL